MKTILSILLLSCMMQDASAQIPVDSFYVPGTTWTVAYPGIDETNCPNFYKIRNEKILYKIENDAIIFGINYHILSVAIAGRYSEPAVGTASCPSTGFDSYTIPINSLVFKKFARLRVDSNKVYFIQDSTFSSSFGTVPLHFILGQEYLLYDFNLIVNSIDTAGFGIYVNSIDSVTLSNGIKVAKYNDTLNGYWNTNNPHYPQTIWGTYYLVWGVGSSFGLLPDSYGALSAYGVGALYPNGDEMSLCYENPTFSYSFKSPVNVLDGNLMSNCFTELSVPIYNTNANEIELFPNPSSTEITITANYTITNIAISNLLGQTVYTHTYNTQRVQVDVEHLPQGMYMVRINDSEIRKFVKE